MDPQHIGWLSCVICLVFTLKCTTIFARLNPNIFFALSMYAAQWGVLIVYYNTLINNTDECRLPEFLPALSGYMCAIVGSIIYRDQNKGIGKHIVFRESFIVWLLVFIVLPEGVELLHHDIDHESIEVSATFVLKSIGFYSLYLAGKSASKNRICIIILFILLFVYWLIELKYTFDWLMNRYHYRKEELVMSTNYLYAFAVIKFLTTIYFVPLVLSRCSNYRKLSFWGKVQHFLHLDQRERKSKLK